MYLSEPVLDMAAFMTIDVLRYWKKMQHGLKSWLAWRVMFFQFPLQSCPLSRHSVLEAMFLASIGVDFLHQMYKLSFVEEIGCVNLK